MKSSLLDSISQISYGFGHREQRCPTGFEKYKEQSSFKWKQIHSTRIAELKEPDHIPGEADGLYTQAPNLALKVITADCVPLLFAKKEGTAVAAIHAGWKGALNRIVSRFFADFHLNPKDWVAALGPSIKPCCYEFGEDLLEKFYNEFTFISREEISPKENTLDLPRVLEKELEQLGVESETLPHCTYCSNSPTFLSYRKRTKLKLDEPNICQWSTIRIKS